MNAKYTCLSAPRKHVFRDVSLTQAADRLTYWLFRRRIPLFRLLLIVIWSFSKRLSIYIYDCCPSIPYVKNVSRTFLGIPIACLVESSRNAFAFSAAVDYLRVVTFTRNTLLRAITNRMYKCTKSSLLYIYLYIHIYIIAFFIISYM